MPSRVIMSFGGPQAPGATARAPVGNSRVPASLSVNPRLTNAV